MISGNRKREVVRAATRLLSLGGIDLTQQIDVFGLIRQNELVLRFMELDRLLGAFVPGEPAGVIVNSRLPPALQRYTAAHEAGHYYLHAEAFALDGASEIEGRTPDHLEEEAQLFASHLLMPLPLMTRAARSVGITRGTAPSADQIYALAGILGVSFTAVLVQLRNLDLITFRQLRPLQSVRPVAVQRNRTFGERIIEPGTHVWTQEEVTGGETHNLYIGDVVAVDLPENRTTGYRWFISPPEIGSGQDLIPFEEQEPRDLTALDRFRLQQPTLELTTTADPQSSSNIPIGGGGRRQILVRANTEGRWRVTFSYAPVHSPRQSLTSVVVEGNLHLRPGQEQRRVLLQEYRAIASEENL